MQEILITGVTSEMQGVGRLEDGRAVFVNGALPGFVHLDKIQGYGQIKAC